MSQENTKSISTDQVRDTGMAMVLILLIVGLLTQNPVFSKLAIPALLLSMTVPRCYYPLAVVWLGFSHFLGAVTSKLLLTLVFFTLVTPVGLLRRLMGKDTLQLKKFKNGDGSVMAIRNLRFEKHHIEKPY